VTAVPKLSPIHPGEILLAEFLEPQGLSQVRLTKASWPVATPRPAAASLRSSLMPDVRRPGSTPR
jgi:hypothetical protein